MQIAGEIRVAGFLSRENLFTCLVELQGSKEIAYLPNSGRLEGLLLPGRTVFLVEKSSPTRKTRYNLVVVMWNGTLVSVDATVPEKLIYRALWQKALPQFDGYTSIQREAIVGRSRLDFLLTRGTAQCLLEVKSVALVREGRALFPDAPTPRGRKHLESLTQAKREGNEAAILFIIQREDADYFLPNDEIDPNFGRALRAAQLQGVAIYAYRCRVNPQEIELADQVPVYL